MSNSLQKRDVRARSGFPLIAATSRTRRHVVKVPTGDVTSASSPRRYQHSIRPNFAKLSFDDEVGAQQERRRHLDINCLGCFEIHRQLELGRLLNGKLSRVRARQHFPKQFPQLPKGCGAKPEESPSTLRII
jgi:hypothetical protein